MVRKFTAPSTEEAAQAPAAKVSASDMQVPGNNAAQMIYSYVERFERLTEEIDALSDDRKEVMAEAKGVGFDTKVLRRIVAIRKLGYAEYLEVEALIDLYLTAVRKAEKAETETSIQEGT